MTQAEARTLWRELTNETDTTAVPNGSVDLYLQAGQEALNLECHYFRKETTSGITLVAGTQEYDLPADCLEVRQVRHGERILKRIGLEELRQRSQDPARIPSGHPEEYYRYGAKIGFVPVPDGAAVAADGTPDVRYVANPTEFSTTAFDQLPAPFHRAVVYYACAEWFATPQSGQQGALSQVWMARFQALVPRIKAHYEGQEPGGTDRATR